MFIFRLAAIAVLALPLATAAGAATVTVTTLNGTQGWKVTNTAGGESSIVDLTGLGGTLESGQPLPSGGVKQTTTANNADKSLVAYAASFGTVNAILSTLSISYSYFKSSGSGNDAAAPTLKLNFGSGNLIYEPYWQGANPTTDVWTTTSIDFTHGLFWTDGMYGVASSAGGPPLHTLQDWLTTFNNGFSNAKLTSIGIGIGSYNQSQVNYFDNVTIAGTNGPNGTYNFQAPTAVPVPATLPLLVGAVGGLGLLRRRKKA
jgi:hypothetical protein